MGTIVPLEEFLADEGYPGAPLAEQQSPWRVEAAGAFRPEDASRFWFLDFHWPRGLTPLGELWNEDGYSWGTQTAAESLPLPRGRGVAVRTAGTHTYAAEIVVRSAAEVADRAGRMSQALPRFLRDFPQIWASRQREIEEDWEELRSVDLSRSSRKEFSHHLVRARRHHKRAFEIHFQLMYPLLANYIAFRGLCTELDIDPGLIGHFLQGYDTKILETDRELWRLTADARAAGLGSLFARTEPERLMEAIAAEGERAAGWRSRFEKFLDIYGWRTEGISDVALASWSEDPISPLGTIKTFLQGNSDHDFEAAHRSAVEEREAAVDAARSTLTLEEQRSFDAALKSSRTANYAWWNEEHDFYIDLRAMLPLRRAALAAAGHLGADRPDDTLFLFWPELTAVVAGERQLAELTGLIEDRRQYYAHWKERRASMPKVLGTVPDAVSDPILIEVFGLNKHFLEAVAAGRPPEGDVKLSGIPASEGACSGRARVLADADNLHRIEAGEVLVCESISPNWTPAFAKIAGCVCDAGGMLSHAAIVGREYGVPTVTAVGLATSTIRDGDEVHVDGTTGTVTVIRTAPDPAAAAQP